MRRIQTAETKEKIRKTLQRYYPPFIRKCSQCNQPVTYTNRNHQRRAERINQICKMCHLKNQRESNHFSEMGKRSVTVQSDNRRSKNEIHFANLCKERFSNVETNKPIFNGWDCDIILTNEKIAILWNGKWHYEKITKQHSVSQVQNRDKIKLEEIIKCGYTPYVIEDRGKENKDLVQLEFEKFQQFLSNL